MLYYQGAVLFCVLTRTIRITPPAIVTCLTPLLGWPWRCVLQLICRSAVVRFFKPAEKVFWSFNTWYVLFFWEGGGYGAWHFICPCWQRQKGARQRSCRNLSDFRILPGLSILNLILDSTGFTCFVWPPEIIIHASPLKTLPSTLSVHPGLSISSWCDLWLSNCMERVKNRDGNAGR